MNYVLHFSCQLLFVTLFASISIWRVFLEMRAETRLDLPVKYTSLLFSSNRYWN